MKARGKALGRGRPLGFLYAWLKASHDAMCNDRIAHMQFAPDLTRRKEAREELKTVHGASGLFDAERPKRDGEDSEPDEV